MHRVTRAALFAAALVSSLGLGSPAHASMPRQQPGAAQDTSGAVKDLPLVELPATGGSTHRMALVISGDGGWAPLVRGVGKRLAANGIDVVGMDARRYLSSAKTPEQAARDVARILRHYRRQWGADRFALIGYSRGADMLPFILRRLPADLRARVDLTAMFGLAPSASFEFHLMDLVRDVKRSTDLAVAPELEALRGARMLCVYGRDEKESACRDADPTLIERVERAGKHHSDGDHDALADLVLSRLPSNEPEPR
jgi:type IV secretory pathway VirJ component